jgi:hypothetical protein
MSDQYLTTTSLARELKADRRQVEKANLEPDATVVIGTRSFELFRRERVKQLAKSFAEAIANEKQRNRK